MTSCLTAIILEVLQASLVKNTRLGSYRRKYNYPKASKSRHDGWELEIILDDNCFT